MILTDDICLKKCEKKIDDRATHVER